MVLTDDDFITMMDEYIKLLAEGEEFEATLILRELVAFIVHVQNGSRIKDYIHKIDYIIGLEMADSSMEPTVAYVESIARRIYQEV